MKRKKPFNVCCDPANETENNQVRYQAKKGRIFKRTFPTANYLQKQRIKLTFANEHKSDPGEIKPLVWKGHTLYSSDEVYTTTDESSDTDSNYCSENSDPEK